MARRSNKQLPYPSWLAAVVGIEHGPSSLHLTPRLRKSFFIPVLGIGQIISWGTYYYSFPLIAEHMGYDLGFSKPEVYGAATVGLLIAGFTTYPIGVAIDHGNGRTVMTLGSFLGGILLLIWSRVGSLWMLYPLLAGIGVVQGMTLYEAAFAVIAKNFGAKVRHGITSLTLWGGFAGTIFVPLVQYLLDSLAWRGALVVLGLINLGICVTLNFIVSNTQSDARTARELRSSQPPLGLEKQDIRWALQQRVFWWLLITFTAYYVTFTGLTYHLYPMLTELVLDPSIAVAAIALLGPSQVAGRFIVWSLEKQVSMQTVGKIVVLAFPIAVGILRFLPPNFVYVAMFSILYGAANGVFTIVRGVAVAEMLTQNSYGAINSLITIPASIAKAAAPLFVALLWDTTDSYFLVLAIILVNSMVVVAAFWIASAQTDLKPHKSKEKARN